MKFPKPKKAGSEEGRAWLKHPNGIKRNAKNGNWEIETSARRTFPTPI